MNEFDELIKADQIKLIKQTEAKRQVELLGSLNIQRGQKFWELNLSTFEIKVVDKYDSNININGTMHKKFTVKENHWYCVAINQKNAERKFLSKARS